MNEDPKITGGLKEAINLAAYESIKGHCTEIFGETVIYHCINLCIENPDIEGGKITADQLKRMDPAKKSELVDNLKKLSKDTILRHAVNAALVHPDSIVFGRSLEAHLFRVKKLKEIGLNLNATYTIDDFIYSAVLNDTGTEHLILINSGLKKDDYMADLFASLASMFGMPETEIGSNEENPEVENNDAKGGDEYNASEFERAGEMTDIHTRKTDPNSSTPTLDEFGIDMTDLAKEGKYDAVIGREKEAKQIIEILCCRKKNNAMVIGKAGTGKTALIEYLAQLIATDNVPSELKGKRIISLSSTTLTAGTIYRGQLEQRVQDICEEVRKNPNIIVFIDEFHSAVSDGSSDISQMLKPSLSRGELTLIAGTTYDEYKKFIEKDSALKRRFQKVYIEEPGRDETFLILQGLRDKYEEYHNVNYPDSVLQACVDWSAKYLYDRNSPDRAIDLMDVSGSRAKLDRPSDGSKIVALEEKIKKVSEKKAELVKKEKFEEAQKERNKQKELETKLEELKASRKKTEVTMEDVAKVVSELVNIPVEKIMNPDLEKLRNMAGLLKDRIIGQDESIEAVTKLLSKQFLGLRDENIPPSLYISGGTGTGKTYLAEEIAKTIFGTEKAMLRIDCGELSQPHTVTKLIGAPPSYVGFGEVALFDKVRERPQQLILVDEADKLCDEILNTIFLNILTTGFITLSNGVEVSFKDCIFIFTSNDGTRDLEAHGKGIGFGLEDKRAMTKEIVMKAIKRRIRPEVINRFSGIIIFNNLGVEEMKKIYVLELRRLEKRLEKKGLTLSVSDDVRDKIISELDLNYGARDLTRGIAKWVEDPICDKILEESIGKKSKVDVCLGKDGMVCVKFKK